MLFDYVLSELGFSKEQIITLKVCVAFILVKVVHILTANLGNNPRNAEWSLVPTRIPTIQNSDSESASKRMPSLRNMDLEIDKCCFNGRLQFHLQESYRQLLEQTTRIRELQLEIDELRRERDILLAEREALILENRRLEAELNSLRQQLHHLETRSLVCPSEALNQSPLSALIHRHNKLRIILCEDSIRFQKKDGEFLGFEYDLLGYEDEEDSDVSDSEED